MTTPAPRIPWNKGRSIGQKKPFTYAEVERIKAHLIETGNLRDLALFAVGFDTMLRGGDLLRLKVSDVQAADGTIRDTFSIQQAKTRHAATVCLTPFTRAIVRRFIKRTNKVGENYLFTSMRNYGREGPISMDQYRKIIKALARTIGLDPALYSSHSLRRTKASLVYRKSRHDIDAVKHLLGHKNISSTSYYLGGERSSALDLARSIEF